jgi:prolyl oligopeptidase family protein
MLLGFDPKRRATESSPIATIDQWHSPVLLAQADDDRRVPFQQTAELLEGLRSHHSYASWMLLFNAADAYFDRQLNKRRAPAPQAGPPLRFGSRVRKSGHIKRRREDD